MTSVVASSQIQTVGKCAICGQDELTSFPVQEMQMGLQVMFQYGHCRSCGAITRLSKVSDLSKYYPPEYYSFKGRPIDQYNGKFKTWLRSLRDRAILTDSANPIARILCEISKESSSLYWTIGHCGVTLSSRILDVGCGSGRLLLRMAELGFRNLLGIDRYLPIAATAREAGVTIINGELSDLKERIFDLIMMHHVLEHCEDQVGQLRLAWKLLAPGGKILIRQPLCDSEAFRRYRSNWFQLDAPRHAVIHSIKSMRALGEKCGLRIREVIWDSTDQQFWASEQYMRGIAMYDEHSYFRNPMYSSFTPCQILEWKREAGILNKNGVGDQAAFYIERDE
jgi:2-polyprenyl-3-methyl-5-hydroxy-6-metoxy-1,4-benzoquinol methylase